ncbi:DUF3854 domain-containing protein [Symmachiella dynata]|uniref:DUF3854 domain-containing protein n=1 Tax=Symmachiella dynata TaxID=2527995 RepID=UPI0018D44EFE|nr:DUF3854 domain-containing protein [Symmachiella dynata]
MIVFPYVWHGIVQHHRVKPLGRLRRLGGKFAKYEQAAGTRNLPFVIRSAGNAIPASGDYVIVIVEGEKKAIALAKVLRDCPNMVVTGTSGIWNWRRKGKFSPEFLELVGDASDAVWVFDSDVVELADFSKKAVDRSKNLKQAAEQACKSTHAAGTRPRLIILPSGESGKVGADDYIVKNGPEPMLSLIEKSLNQGNWAFHLRHRATVGKVATGKRVLAEVEAPQNQPVTAADIYEAVMMIDIGDYPDRPCENPVSGVFTSKETGRGIASIVDRNQWGCCPACTNKKIKLWMESLRKGFACDVAAGRKLYAAHIPADDFNAGAFTATMRRLGTKLGRRVRWVRFHTSAKTVRVIISEDPAECRCEIMKKFKPISVENAIRFCLLALGEYSHDSILKRGKRPVIASGWRQVVAVEPTREEWSLTICRKGTTLADLKEAADREQVAAPDYHPDVSKFPLHTKSEKQVLTIVRTAELIAKMREKRRREEWGAGQEVTVVLSPSEEFVLGKRTTQAVECSRLVQGSLLDRPHPDCRT